MNSRILHALGHLYDDEQRHWQTTADYRFEHGINISQVAGHCGCPTVTPITLLPHRRFDLPNPNDETVEGCVIEARAADGETVIDLVAWPIADPADVRTLCGAAPMVGLWSALNPGTYTFNYPLVVYRSPLAWLNADCEGAAVAVPKLAVQTLLEITDIGGRIGAQDAAHAGELRGLLQALVDQVEIVAPKPIRRAA